MTSPNYGAAAPRGGYGYGYGGGLFGRGFFGGLFGAGLLGLFLGRGLFGGLGGSGSLLGLLIQIGLLILLAKWAIRRFSGAQPRFAGGLFGAPGGSYPGGAAYSAYGTGAGPGPGGRPLAVQSEDLSAFEWLLQESQTAFGAEDLDRVRRVSTPEMASYFAEQIAQNARRGLVNKLADVRLLKGDVSEAWQDGSGEYATVAMRFSLLDWTVDRTSGELVEGDPRTPQEAAEVWTFRRDFGSGPRGWKISAIQQAVG
jgi:predicted lipid-binding transport protein (Tim44 family)